MSHVVVCPVFQIYLLIHLLSPWSRALDKLTSPQPVKKLPTFFMEPEV